MLLYRTAPARASAGVGALFGLLLAMLSGASHAADSLPDGGKHGLEPQAGQSPSPVKFSDAAPARIVPVEAKKPPARRLVVVAGNRIALNARHWPILGKPDAKYIFVEMFDYTCPHCQATHAAIQGARERYGDDVAIVALACPLNGPCHSASSDSNSYDTDACEVARIAVAVWRVEPTRFEQFHAWLFQPTTARTAAEARRQAAELVGEAAIRNELAQPWAGKYIAKHIELYQRAGGGNVPKLLFPQATIVGEVNSTDTLCDLVKRELGAP